MLSLRRVILKSTLCNLIEDPVETLAHFINLAEGPGFNDNHDAE